MLKSSTWIQEQAKTHDIIEPFVSQSVRDGVISYGLGPYGYDIRLHDTFRRPVESLNVIDPHNSREEQFETLQQDRIVIPPNAYILGRSLEYFRMPSKVLGIVFGKSTYARCGILVNVTPLEPEWEGYLTISISNVSGRHTAVYANEGIAQLIFLESDGKPAFSYKDVKGKYDGQQDITISKIQ